MKKICFLLVALVIILFSPSSAAQTSIYYKGGVLSLDQPEVGIVKIYGIKLSPINITVESGNKETFIPRSLENLSSATSNIIIEIKYVSPEGWTAELLCDENKDGIHDWWEFNRLSKTQQLGEGAVLHFFLKLTRPDNAGKGDRASAAVKASGTVKDGSGYTGYNGIIYGGEDEVETTDTVIVK